MFMVISAPLPPRSRRLGLPERMKVPVPARIDQAALARLGIAARHGRVVELQLGREFAQRGQPVAHGEAAGLDVVGDQLGQQQVGRPGAVAQLLAPVGGDRVHRRS